LTDPRASPGRRSNADWAIPLLLGQAAAVLKNITAREDMVSVQLYGNPRTFWEYSPLIALCFRVNAVDDTGAEHKAALAAAEYLRTNATASSDSGLWWTPRLDNSR
jgi:hypothetical protein